MMVFFLLLLSATALKMNQPELDKEMDTVEMEGIGHSCSSGFNFKCYKKGGHALDKENAATYLRREVGIMSVAITVHADCKAGQQITFGAASCGGVDATWAAYDLTGDNVASNEVITVIDSLVKGDRCPATAAPTVASVVVGTAGGGWPDNCKTGAAGAVTIGAVVRQTVAQTTAHYTVKMSGHGLHADDPSTKLVLGATAADATKCYSLECLYGASDAMTCATAPAVTALPSVLWWCNGNSLEAVYSNAAACAATLQTAINVGGVGTDCHDMLNWYLCPNFVLPTCA